MSITFVFLTAFAAAAPEATPLERLDAAETAGQETLAVVTEEMHLGGNNRAECEQSLPAFSAVWILGRKDNQVEIAIRRLGDVVQTGWVPSKVLRQGEAALELVGEEVAHNPKNVHARLAMAYLLAYSREGSKIINVLPIAAGLCEDALRIDPQCIEALALLAALLSRLGAHHKAIIEINKALSLKQHPWLHLARGMFHVNAAHYGDAVIDFEQSLATAPEGWHYRQHARAELERARAQLKAKGD